MSQSLKEFEETFNEETRLRSYRIVCEDRVFNVNGFSLSEQSPFFEKLFFGQFVESDDKTLTITPDSEISSSDVMEYLFVFYGKKQVTVDNCAAMIRLGDIWDTPVLREKCKVFLESGDYSRFSSNLYDMLQAALNHGLKSSVLNLVNLIGESSLETLRHDGFLKKITDPSTVATVFEMVGRRNIVGDNVHVYVHCPSYLRQSVFCPRDDCKHRVCFFCSKCGAEVCAKHRQESLCDTPAQHTADSSILFNYC